jgi:hypothetical protein
MEKLIIDGKVAVLYSPGYGAGWYSWNLEHPEIVFDSAIVKLVESEKFNELETYMTLKYPDMYLGGMRDLVIKWLPLGTKFRIDEYDGNESVEILGDIDWLEA